MTAPAASLRPFRVAPLVALAAPFACALWAFWTTLADLAQAWKDPQFSHGFLVPAFAVLLLWMRRDKLDLAAARPSLWGALLLGFGLGLRLIGSYAYYVWLDPISIVPCVAGLVLLLGGREGWRWAWPSVLFLAFMIPLPYRVANALSGPLQRLATVTSTFVMQVLGLPAIAEGNVILLNDHQIGIVEACSGLRMLVVFFALSTAVVLVIQRHWVDRSLVLLSAIPIAVLSNIVRVTTTGIMFEMGHSEMANAFFHDVAGWLMMPLALGMLWIELKVLSHLFIDLPAPPPPVRRAPAATPRQAGAPRPAASPRPRRAAKPAPAKREAAVAVEPTAEK